MAARRDGPSVIKAPATKSQWKTKKGRKESKKKKSPTEMIKVQGWYKDGWANCGWNGRMSTRRNISLLDCFNNLGGVFYGGLSSIGHLENGIMEDCSSIGYLEDGYRGLSSIRHLEYGIMEDCLLFVT
ncbi:hypothetical protein CEXT_793551 [Caerostris extrusa]|uniref:Uncharacterized protein n=1 Tax=Caerostris extrusa TaxID=172846 RepID=A0AAV4STV2_CAEEX|nr:hypothetical protein CEXT_793551 [Caerostris extrusa]